MVVGGTVWVLGPGRDHPEDQAEMGLAGGALGPVEPGRLTTYSQCTLCLQSTDSMFWSPLGSGPPREIWMARESSGAEVYTYTRCAGFAHASSCVCVCARARNIQAINK